VADINLEKKSGPGPWVWIAGLVVLALVVWGVMEFTGNDRRAGDDRQTTPAAEQWEVEQQQQPLPRTEPYTPPPGGQQDPNTGVRPGTTNPAGLDDTGARTPTGPGTGPGTGTTGTGTGTGGTDMGAGYQQS
jgi:penicillin G amidase